MQCNKVTLNSPGDDQSILIKTLSCKPPVLFRTNCYSRENFWLVISDVKLPFVKRFFFSSLSLVTICRTAACLHSVQQKTDNSAIVQPAMRSTHVKYLSSWAARSHRLLVASESGVERKWVWGGGVDRCNYKKDKLSKNSPNLSLFAYFICLLPLSVFEKPQLIRTIREM